jgi:hypothetical protein
MVCSEMPRMLDLRFSQGNQKTSQRITPWLVARKRTLPTERPPLVAEVSANTLLKCLEDWRNYFIYLQALIPLERL